MKSPEYNADLFLIRNAEPTNTLDAVKVGTELGPLTMNGEKTCQTIAATLQELAHDEQIALYGSGITKAERQTTLLVAGYLNSYARQPVETLCNLQDTAALTFADLATIESESTLKYIEACQKGYPIQRSALILSGLAIWQVLGRPASTWGAEGRTIIPYGTVIPARIHAPTTDIKPLDTYRLARP